MRIPIFLLLILFAVKGYGDPPVDNLVMRLDYDVVLMPTDDFPSAAMPDIEKAVKNDSGLRIRVMLALGTGEWAPYSDRPQYDPEVLKNIALPVIERLKNAYGGKVYIILTTRDLNSSDKSLRFVFGEHYETQKISVFSVARMLAGEDDKQASPALILSRIRKFMLRTIGIQYYKLPRSADIHNVMYSPIMSLDDLDAMGMTLNTK